MVKKHLGDTIDIHGGGSDLTFPHHENEAAQSRCANDSTYVRYWLHNGMLNLGTEKMSKSLGNVLTIRNLLKTQQLNLRYALLSGQYRSLLTWFDELLAQARASLDSLYQSLRDAGSEQSITSADFQDVDINEYPKVVVIALSDDLNSPQGSCGPARTGESAATGNGHRSQECRRTTIVSGRLTGTADSDPRYLFHSRPA